MLRRSFFGRCAAFFGAYLAPLTFKKYQSGYLSLRSGRIGDAEIRKLLEKARKKNKGLLLQSSTEIVSEADLLIDVSIKGNGGRLVSRGGVFVFENPQGSWQEISGLNIEGAIILRNGFKQKIQGNAIVVKKGDAIIAENAENLIVGNNSIDAHKGVGINFQSGSKIRLIENQITTAPHKEWVQLNKVADFYEDDNTLLSLAA